MATFSDEPFQGSIRSIFEKPSWSPRGSQRDPKAVHSRTHSVSARYTRKPPPLRCSTRRMGPRVQEGISHPRLKRAKANRKKTRTTWPWTTGSPSRPPCLLDPLPKTTWSFVGRRWLVCGRGGIGQTVWLCVLYCSKVDSEITCDPP